jgi:hypothetical protein
LLYIGSVGSKREIRYKYIPFFEPPETRRRRERASAISSSMGKSKGDVARETCQIPGHRLGRQLGVNRDGTELFHHSHRSSLFHNRWHSRWNIPWSNARTLRNISHLLVGFFHRFFCLVLYSSPHPQRCHPGMGRPSWATPEQLSYLKSFVHLLPQAKGSTSLVTLYAQVYEGFLAKWPPAPMAPEPGKFMSPEELEAKAKQKLESVCIVLNSVFIFSQPASASATGIKRSERRRSTRPSHPPNQHLASSTYLANRSARHTPTSLTKHSLFAIGNRRILRSAVNSRTSGSGGTRMPFKKSSNRSSMIPSRLRPRPQKN